LNCTNCATGGIYVNIRDDNIEYELIGVGIVWTSVSLVSLVGLVGFVGEEEGKEGKEREFCSDELSF